jgi:phosphate transport system substrate-binding protein
MKTLLILWISASLVVGSSLTARGAGESSTRAAGDAAPLKGTITLSGAWALYPMAVRWAEEFQKLNPGVRFDIGAGGAGKGMADALAGVVDLGMVSREIYGAEIERGAWWVSVTKDAVVAVVSADNPAIEDLNMHGVDREKLRALWMEEGNSRWGTVSGGDSQQSVRVYTRSDACGAAQTWAQYLGGTQEDLRGVGVYGDPGLADAVRRDALGIGFNNINYVYDATTKLPVAGLAIVKIDLNGDGTIDAEEDFYGTRDRMAAAIASGVYPSPPARDLHFVSKGRPTNPVVIAFLRWILTDGQAYVDEAGYIRLTEKKLETGLASLEP